MRLRGPLGIDIGYSVICTVYTSRVNSMLFIPAFFLAVCSCHCLRFESHSYHKSNSESVLNISSSDCSKAFDKYHRSNE